MVSAIAYAIGQRIYNGLIFHLQTEVRGYDSWKKRAQRDGICITYAIGQRITIG